MKTFKKSIYGLTICLLSLTTSSCTDDLKISEESESDEVQYFELTVTQETPPSTRLTMDADALTTTWDEGDQLVLVDKSGEQDDITLDCTITNEAKTKAKFYASRGVPAGDYWVVYNYPQDKIFYNWAAATIDNFNTKKSLSLLGELTVNSDEKKASINLQHLYAMLHFEFKNVPAEFKTTTIGMYYHEKPFFLNKSLGSQMKGLVPLHNIVLSDNYNFGSSPTLYSLVFPEDYTTGTLKFYSIIGNKCYVFDKTNINIEAGYNYNVVLDFERVSKIYNKPSSPITTVDEWNYGSITFGVGS
jgi:hypothetical protein